MPSDGSQLIIGIVLICVFLLLKGFFTACETAVIEINDAKLKSLAEKDRKAKRLAVLLEKPAGLLTALSVHRIFSAVIIAMLSAVMFFAPLAEFFVGKGLVRSLSLILSAVIVILATTLVLAVFGETLPKKLLSKGSDSFAIGVAGILKAFVAVMKPITALVSGLTYVFGRIFGISGAGSTDAVTEEEILMMVDAGNETGVIEESQREMINNIFEFGDLEISDVMTHRTDIVAVADDEKISSVVYDAINHGFSRIPVYHGGIDNIVGLIHVKDLLCLVGCEDTDGLSLKDFMREALYVPATNKCDEVFKKLTAQKAQMAVAVDEYGGTAGIVTTEDLLEAIVGSMQDEYDNESEELVKVSDNVYTIDGTADPETIIEKLGGALPDDREYDTIGGFVIDLLGRIPREDETPSVTYGNIEFTVLLTEDKRVSRIKAVITPEEEE